MTLEEENENSKRISAVSYTHLDVYKRQLTQSPTALAQTPLTRSPTALAKIPQMQSLRATTQENLTQR